MTSSVDPQDKLPQIGSKSAHSRLPALEGLRGLAAMMVVFAHLTLGFAPGFSPGLHEVASRYSWLGSRLIIGSIEWLYDGHYAVWVFWVMSAIVLSLRFFQLHSTGNDRKARSYLYGATVRRYPRLVIPILASVMLGYLLQVAGWMHNQQAAPIVGSSWLNTHYAFVSSLAFAMREAFWGAFYKHDMDHTYNAALWTMHAELIGSMFVFALMWLVSWIGFRWVIYVILSIMFLITHYDYLNGFLAGLVICDLLVMSQRENWIILVNRYPVIDRIRHSRVVSIAALILLLILAGQPNDRQMMIILLAVLTCGLVLVLAPLNDWLSTRLPVFLGKISFGVYLVHMPILTSYSSLVYLKYFSSYSPLAGFVLVGIVTIPVVLLAGWVFHRLIDAPAVRYSKMIQDRVLRLIHSDQKVDN